VTTDEDLRRLAEAAPDGPWIEDPDEPGVVMRPDGWDGEMVAVANGDFYRVIAAFIAAANPAAVLALLDRVAAAEADNARLTRAVTTLDRTTDDLAASCVQVEAENAALRETVKRVRAVLDANVPRREYDIQALRNDISAALNGEG
jgi:hypothetical protein